MADGYDEFLNHIIPDDIALQPDRRRPRGSRPNYVPPGLQTPQPDGQLQQQCFAPISYYGCPDHNTFQTDLLPAPLGYLPNVSENVAFPSIDSAYGSSPLVDNTGLSTGYIYYNPNGSAASDQSLFYTTERTSLSDDTALPNANQGFHEPSHTQYEHISPMSPPIPPQQRHSVPLKRARGNSDGDCFVKDQNILASNKLSASYLIGVTADQEIKLCQHQNEWERADHLPTEPELKALATLTKLKLFQVALWFGDRLRITSAPFGTCNQGTSCELDQSVLNDIANDIQKANVRHCANGQSKKVVGGKYRCTWNCGFSTDSRNAWERHEELKQPQKFWHCAACRDLRHSGERGGVFIAHRPDKFLPHADTCHQGEDRQQLRARSEVNYTAPFVRRCTICHHRFVNWKERNRHYFQHFEEEARDDGPSPPDDSGDGSDDDGSNDDPPWSPSNQDNERSHSHRSNANNSGHQADNSNPGDGGSGSYGSSYGTSYTVNHKPSICGRAAYPSGCSPLLRAEVCVNTNEQQASLAGDLAAQWLIDIKGHCIVEAKREHRYIALNYPVQNRISTSCLESASTLPSPTLQPAHKLPSPFQTAIHLIRATGFDYVWIDVLCGLKQGSGGADSAYRQASLILAIGPLSHDWRKIWHYFCDYDQLYAVESLGSHGVSFHHLKELGHGAYSIVDKVQLRPTLSTLARKCVFRTDSKMTLAACWIQEIQIMKKLKHPHITTFVAAYHDQRAFNILMWPVAECDMRQYLSYPDQFPGKRQHLPTWFMSLAEALAYVHKMKCRHKDIKPANILIYGDKVLLTDFGASTDFSTSVSTSTGGALMTPKYCAPEVAAKGKRGRSADVFSLGCVFAEMITVHLGRSLEEMHQRLGMGQGSHDRRATYYNHTTELKRWLEMLLSKSRSAHQQRVLHTTKSMVAKQQSHRPRASSITRALCCKEHCDGLQQGATCHCCPRSKASIITSNKPVLPASTPCLPSKKAAASPPCQPTKGKELLSINYHTPNWSFTSEIQRDRTGQYDISFTRQPRGCKPTRANRTSTGTPSLQGSTKTTTTDVRLSSKATTTTDNPAITDPTPQNANRLALTTSQSRSSSYMQSRKRRHSDHGNDAE